MLQLQHSINSPSFRKYIAIIYLVGVFGLSFSISRNLFIQLIPINILLANLLLFYSALPINIRFLWPVTFIGIMGFFLDYWGVETGMIFGSYDYGTVMGPKVLGIPLLIGVNWIFVVVCAVQIAKKWISRPVFIPFLAGILVTFYDFWLEAFAIRYGLWTWYAESVPIQNYIAWFFIGSFFASVYFFTNRNKEIPIAPALFIIQLLFFFILYWLP